MSKKTKCKPPKPDNTEPIPRKEVISIQPGDVAVVTTPYKLSAQSSNKLKFDVAEMMSDGVDVIVLSGGATMEVYREKGKYVDVAGIDGAKQFTTIREQVKE